MLVNQLHTIGIFNVVEAQPSQRIEPEMRQRIRPVGQPIQKSEQIRFKRLAKRQVRAGQFATRAVNQAEDAVKVGEQIRAECANGLPGDAARGGRPADRRGGNGRNAPVRIEARCFQRSRLPGVK